MIIKVTFKRVYEVDESVVHNRLSELGYEDVEMDEDIMKEIGTEIAKDWLSDEAPLFLSNIEDFVSANVELKSN